MAEAFHDFDGDKALRLLTIHSITSGKYRLVWRRSTRQIRLGFRFLCLNRAYDIYSLA